MSSAVAFAVGYGTSVMHVTFAAGKAARPPVVRTRDLGGPSARGPQHFR